MASQLNTYVHVHGPDGSVAFGPGDDVPAWARKQITRDDVWGDADKATPTDADEPDTGDSSDVPAEPPRAGAGSGIDAWRDFASHPDVDLDVDPDASRDDIIAAWDAVNADG